MTLTLCPPDVAALAGLWTRTLLRTAEGEDRRTNVTWLQGPSLFADLRQPADRPDFSHVTALADLTWRDCLWLARQQGFAGVFQEENGIFWWQREIDFQPVSPLPDAGKLAWNGEVLVETGHFDSYLEHWQREPNLPAKPCEAVRLRRASDGRDAIFVRAGEAFMFARARPQSAVPQGTTLSAAVEAAPDLAAAQALLDCEISLGSAGNWHITRSTLPFRENTTLTLTGWDVVTRESLGGA